LAAEAFLESTSRVFFHLRGRSTGFSPRNTLCTVWNVANAEFNLEPLRRGKAVRQFAKADEPQQRFYPALDGEYSDTAEPLNHYLMVAA
jgi:hypothetical protein